MVTFHSLSFFLFQVEGEGPGIVVFVRDLADRAHLNDLEFDQRLPPRYEADRFFAWCEARGLNPVRDTSEEDDELWEVPAIDDPALRFEFKMCWGR